MIRHRIGALRACIPGCVAFFVASTATAQDATVGVGAQTTVPPHPPAAAANMPAGSEHDLFVGHLAFGWYGTRPVPVGSFMPGIPALLQTPVVGVRYWATPMIGIDGGLGFFTTSGSTNTQPAGITVDSDTRTTFVLHGGVPLALANSGHFSFQVTPELDVGFGSGTLHAMAPAVNTDQSGFLLQVGGRVGGEVHFGFIGIPQLALDASVGLFLASRTGKNTTGAVTVKASELTIDTQNVSQPWDIFRTNIAVRYYF
jgi:hypothetical protein